ncbi:hypothetical protein JTE90_013862 [Oedothorax gibbosus]|uniref:Uncharacterized protein n=1 Tax=Oedothorax gibbosus TaxID=931172 RepID=A0AAV6V9I7_9ARAC|nr:hypothetical protein JTE90_013862 [Oedothorax gibbosus]
MLANVMYILPMLLGRTFDARHDRVGIDIFPQSELDRQRILEEPETVSRYETTDSAEEVRNLLEVSADLALKVKAGKLEFKGTGDYLRDTSYLGRVMEILTRIKFTTVSVALPPEVQPIAGWTLKNKRDLGTHFVRSVTYGGELLASIKFKANKESDFNSISAEIHNNFNGGDATNLVAEGKLEQVQNKLRDKANMEISYYATVPLKGVPNTIDGLRNLVRDFSQHVKEVNDGWGVPIRVELMELSSLGGVNSSEFRFIKDFLVKSCSIEKSPEHIDGLRNLVRDFSQHVKEVNDGWGVPIRVELMELSSLGGVNSSEFRFIKDFLVKSCSIEKSRTHDGLRNLVRDFSQHVKEVNDGWGVPLEWNSWSCHPWRVNSSEFRFIKMALESELADLEHEFDDLRKAHTMLQEWYRTLPTSIAPEQEEEINKLNQRIQKILRPYYDSIGNLDIEQPPEKQLSAAREAYKEGKLSALPGKFTKEVMRMQKRIVVKERKLYGTGTSTYTRWGTKECPKSPMISKLHTGIMSSTTNRGTGGASDYICLPENLGIVGKDVNDTGKTDNSVFISGVKYGLMDDHPFEEGNARYYFGKGVPCAVCHLTNRTLIHQFPARSTCPDDWLHEYSGYLMAGSNLPGKHACMDIKPEANEHGDTQEDQQAHTLSLVHVSDKDGGLPMPPYTKNSAVKCVVCSK